MNAVIALRVRKTGGAISHLASALPKYGLLYRGHDIYGSAADQCRVVIQAEGPEPKLDEIPSGLCAFDEVIEVLSVRTRVDGRDDDPPVTDNGQEDPVVNEILWAYPRICSLVNEYEEKLPADECVHRMTKLGIRVGKHLGAGHGQLIGARTVDAALQNSVLPALQGLVAGEVVGSGLMVGASVFLRQNLDMLYLAVDEPRGCCFLKGLIQGMLGEAPFLPRLWVTETECQESGDAHCYFHVEQV